MNVFKVNEEPDAEPDKVRPGLPEGDRDESARQDAPVPGDHEHDGGAEGGSILVVAVNSSIEL